MNKMNRERSWQLARSFGLCLVFGGPLAAGCGATTEGRVGLAAVCSVNSDCDSPLVCTFGLCHAACKKSGDCTGNARCVTSNGAGVCQLDDEAMCTYTSQCTAPLACAADRQCRNKCEGAPDCLPSQVCTPSGSCADSTEVNSNGELKNASPDGGTHVGGDGSGGRSSTAADGGGVLGGGGMVNGGGSSNVGGGKDFGAGGGPSGTDTGGGPSMPGCGNVNQPCCGPDQTCGASALCFQGGCVSCGALSQRCCAGDTCASNSATCANGSCVSCGAQGQPCCGSACDSSLACSSGTCDVPCTAPYVPHGGVCVALPPRPVAPLSGSNVSTRSPKLSWVLPSGIPAAHVDVCQDRACTHVLFASDVTGSSVVVGATLPKGTAFWRLLAKDALGTIPSPVWEMQVGGAHDAPISTAWGAVPDFDGDGHADVVIQTGSGAGTATRIYSGTPTGLSSTFVTLGAGGGGGGPGSAFAVSDLDGDGYLDLVLPTGPGMSVYPGTKSGISVTSSQTLNVNTGGESGETAGDVNGDGYGDLVVPAHEDDGQGNSFLSMNVYSGGPSGLSITPQSFTTAILRQAGFGGSDTGDVNGDGFADVIVASTSGGMGGTAAVFYGGASGLSTSPTTIAVSNTPNFSVSCAGDVNGDGYDDVLIGTTNSVSVYYGGSSGLAATAAASVSTFGQPGKSQGNLLGLGDANGDGYSDIVVPATTPPGLRVFLGSATGLQTGAPVTLQPTAPPSFVVSNANIEALSALGDVNGDGFTDLGLEVDWTSTSQVQNHQVYVFSGGSPVATSPATTLSLVANGIR